MSFARSRPALRVKSKHDITLIRLNYITVHCSHNTPEPELASGDPRPRPHDDDDDDDAI